MIKSKGIFLVKLEKQDEKFIDNLEWNDLIRGYENAKDFFMYEGEISPIRIYLLYSPEEYLFFSGYPKHEKWMRAFTGYNNTIYIFAPSVVEEYTIHTNEDFINVLIHEITHLFYGYSSMKKGLTTLPLWNEGIANYIAGKKMTKVSFDLSTLKDFKEDSSANYHVGYFLVKSIMDYFKDEGNKRILRFLKEAKYADSEDVLFKKFGNIFGIDANRLIELKGGEKE